MAQIVELPSVPNTSLSRLGDIILGSAAQYGANKRQTDHEAQLRAQQVADRDLARANQLADVGSARAYEQQTHDTRRKEGIQDAVTQAELQFKSELMRLGYKVDTAEDYAAARADFQKSELFKRYADALADGSLLRTDFGDAAKMAAGLAKHDARLAARSSFSDANQANALAGQNQLLSERAALTAGANTLDAGLMEQPRKIDQKEIDDQAYIAAKSLLRPSMFNKDPIPSQQQINDQKPAIKAALEKAAVAQWQEKMAALIAQKQLNQSRLSDVTRLYNDTANTSHVFGVPVATPASSPVVQPPPPGADAVAAARDAWAKKMGGVQPPPPPVTTVAPQPAQPVANGMSQLADLGLIDQSAAQPMIQQGRNRTLAPITPQMLDAAEKAARDEIARLATITPNRAIQGRLQILQQSLADIAQRRRDQMNTIQARSSLSAPVSTATDTMPRAPAVDTGWWNPAVGSAPSQTAPTF